MHAGEVLLCNVVPRFRGEPTAVQAHQLNVSSEDCHVLSLAPPAVPDDRFEALLPFRLACSATAPRALRFSVRMLNLPAEGGELPAGRAWEPLAVPLLFFLPSNTSSYSQVIPAGSAPAHLRR